MSCTIDHLRVDARVTVQRDFTDLAGRVVRAGESGIIRGLGLDYARMEIWIELQRNDLRDTLRFALRAIDGPRNGHMREFFASGDSVETPSAFPAQTAECVPAESPPRRVEPEPPSISVPALDDEPPSREASSQALTVACSCGPDFHRPLLPARGELSVYACLRCGTVTCSRCIGDDGRFTGNAWLAYQSVELSERAIQWLGRLPRVKEDHSGANVRWPMAAELVRYPTLYIPADTRCRDSAALAELESRLSRTEAAQSIAERLRLTCRITGPPPADLLPKLPGYGGLWEALELRPDSDVSALLHHAQLHSIGSALAVDLLLRRPDSFEIMVRALRSSDSVLRGAGFAMARDMRPVDLRLAGVLIELLGALSFEPLGDVPGRVVSWARFELFFLVAAEARLATPEMLATLRTLMRKLARHDATLVDCVRVVIRELDLLPQS